MRKYFVLWVLVLCFSVCFSAEASIGRLDILTDEEEEFTFTYTKVAAYKNGEFVLEEPFKDSGLNLNEILNGSDTRKATEILMNYDAVKKEVETKNQIAQIGSLSEGVYLIEGIPEKGYEISATLVAIPQWDSDENEMSYHVTVIPKIQRAISVVETGDDTRLEPLIMLCIVSLAIVIGVSGKAYFLKDK